MEQKTLNIVILSDTHLGFDYPLRPKVKKARRGEDFFRNFTRVLEEAERKNADAIIHCGDLFFRSKVPLPIVERTFEILHKTADSGLPIYIVPGNHERSWIPQTLFHRHENIHIFDQPKTFILAKNGIKLNLSGFPNIRNGIRPQFKQIVKSICGKISNGDFHLLCFHQSVDGAVAGPHRYVFRNDPDTIAAGDIPEEFDIIISGHIHPHQFIQNDLTGEALPTPVLYPGSTERTSFAELGEEKGYIVLTLEKNVGVDWTFVPLETRPMIVLNLNMDHLKTNGSITDFVAFQLHQLPTNANIQIKFSGEKNLPLIRSLLQNIHQQKKEEMIIHFNRKWWDRNV